MFFPTLLKDPDLLSREFSFVEEPGFRSDLAVLSECLRSAGTDPVSLRRARIAFDYMISDHLPLMVSAALHAFSAGTPSKAGALLLLHLSYLMMLSGLVLLQIAADPGRNDFLPESMTLFLAGRGSLLMETLPPELKASLWHFLSMFRNRRVSSLSLLFSSEENGDPGWSVHAGESFFLPSATFRRTFLCFCKACGIVAGIPSALQKRVSSLFLSSFSGFLHRRLLPSLYGLRRSSPVRFH